MDVVAHEPRPPRLPPAPLAVGLALLLVLATCVVTVARRLPGDNPPRVAAPPSATRSPSPSPAPLAQAYPGIPKPPPPDAAQGEWALPALAQPTGVLLAGPGRKLRVLDIDSGESVDLPMPGDGARRMVPMFQIPGGWLVSRDAKCEEDPCPPSPTYTVRRDGTTSLGPAVDADLDPDGQSVWLTRTDRARTARWVEPRTFDGKKGRPARTTLRTDEHVIGVLPGTLIVARASVSEAVVSAIDIATAKRTVINGAGLGLAVSGADVAWVSSGCHHDPPRECALNVTGLDDGRTTSLPISGPVLRAAFDPSGRYLAIAFLYGDNGEAARVYDLTDGSSVPLGLSHPPLIDTLTWAPNGWLVITHGRYEPDYSVKSHGVALWRPGAAHAYEGPSFRGPSTYVFLPVTTARP